MANEINNSTDKISYNLKSKNIISYLNTPKHITKTFNKNNTDFYCNELNSFTIKSEYFKDHSNSNNKRKESDNNSYGKNKLRLLNY